MSCDYSLADNFSDVNVEWECPHEVYEDNQYCLFHLDSPSGIKPGDYTETIIKELESDDLRKNRFFGANIPELDLGHIALRTTGVDRLSLSYSEIGYVSAESVDINFDIKLSHTTMGEVEVTDCQLEKWESSDAEYTEGCDFANSTFRRRASFDAKFSGKVNFGNTEFRSEAWFADADFESWTWFGNSAFRDHTVFSGSVFDGQALFSGAEFLETSVFTGVVFNAPASFSKLEATSRLAFVGAKITRSLSLYDSTVEEISLKAGSDKTSIIDLRESSLQTGELSRISGSPDYLSEEVDSLYGDVYYLLDESTLGDVVVDGNNLDKYRFRRTDFSGFRFENIREGLLDINWDISKFGLSNPSIEQIRRDMVKNLDPEIEEWTTEDYIITYMNAKACASEDGDDEAASNFFIKEMRNRRKRWRKEAFSGESPLLVNVTNLSRFTANYIMDFFSRYGERPMRVVGIAVVSIVIPAILYPTGLIGRIKRDTVISYSNTNSAVELAYTLKESLYFSSSAFTTLVYGGIKPVDTLSQLTAVSQAFLGSFLIALFIYSLSKQASR